MSEPILEFQGQYRWLSNFWAVPVVFDGVTYQSVEHAYQAAKTIDPRERAQFLGTTASQAKRLGQQVTLRPNWDGVKLGVMNQLLWDKFTRHQDLRRLLLATGDAKLVEGNNWGDTYWGVCAGKGENWLGILLMVLRSHLMIHR